MDYSRKGIRDRVYAKLDWAANDSPEQNARLDLKINEAIKTVSKVMPSQSWERESHFTLPVNFQPIASDTVSVNANDAWVIVRDNPSTGDYEPWDDDRHWDGRWILIKDSNDVWQRRQIRTVWSVGDQQYLSLVTPWPNRSDEEMAYYIDLNSRTYLDGDVQQIRDVRIVQPIVTYPVVVVPPERQDACWNGSPPGTPTANGPATVALRTPASLPAPPLTPDPSLTGSNTIGDNTKGTFQYVFTLCWGLRETNLIEPGPAMETTQGPSIEREFPLFESPPSPESEEINNYVAPDYKIIRIQVPDYEHALGFSNVGSPREGRTGFYIRIYRKWVGNTTSIPVPEAYYLLDEVSADGAFYDDDGTRLVDLGRPLRPNMSYTGVSFSPASTQETTLAMRYLMRTRELTSDTDVLDISSDAIDLVVLEAAALLAGSLGRRDEMRDIRAEFERLRGGVAAQNETQYSANKPIRKARVTTGGWGGWGGWGRG